MGENQSAWRKNWHIANFTNTNSTSSTTALKPGLGSEKRARNHMRYVTYRLMYSRLWSESSKWICAVTSNSLSFVALMLLSSSQEHLSACLPSVPLIAVGGVGFLSGTNAATQSRYVNNNSETMMSFRKGPYKLNNNYTSALKYVRKKKL